jgi:hypothetical protein
LTTLKQYWEGMILALPVFKLYWAIVTCWPGTVSFMAYLWALLHCLMLPASGHIQTNLLSLTDPPTSRRLRRYWPNDLVNRF